MRVQDPRVQNEGSWNSYVDYKIFLHVSASSFCIGISIFQGWRLVLRQNQFVGVSSGPRQKTWKKGREERKELEVCLRVAFRLPGGILLHSGPQSQLWLDSLAPQWEWWWGAHVNLVFFCLILFTYFLLQTNSKAFTAKTSCVRRRYREFVWLRKQLQRNAGLVWVCSCFLLLGSESGFLGAYLGT